MAVRVNIVDRVVQNIGVFVQALWVSDVSKGQRTLGKRVVTTEGIHGAAGEFVGGEEPAIGGGVVARDEEVEASFRVTFLAGELVRRGAVTCVEALLAEGQIVGVRT